MINWDFEAAKALASRYRRDADDAVCEAIADERERCALIAESWAERAGDWSGSIAAEIRGVQRDLTKARTEALTKENAARLAGLQAEHRDNETAIHLAALKIEPLCE